VTDPFPGLRATLLEASPATFGITTVTEGHGVWGLLVDMGFAAGVATVAMTIDGDASLYYQGGGGIIGGVGIPAVAKVARAVTIFAEQFVEACTPAREVPLPAAGKVALHILTTKGIWTGRATRTELESTEHPLSQLYLASQGVVTELRLAEAAEKQAGVEPGKTEG
jgi:hypothetical protein